MIKMQTDRNVTAVTSLNEVLDLIEKTLRRFTALPEAWHYPVCSLWVFHTHAIDSFKCTPRLMIMSPEPGSGKSTLLELLSRMSQNSRISASPSSAAVYRLIEDCERKEDLRPTFFFDEVDHYLGNSKFMDRGLLALLNSGYRKGTAALRAERRGDGFESRNYSTFAAVACAGLRTLPDTISSRSIHVAMKPRLHSVELESFEDERVEEACLRIQKVAQAWVSEFGYLLEHRAGNLPVSDRAADVWEPLIRIADLAGEPWNSGVRKAAFDVSEQSKPKYRSLGISLLSQMHNILSDREQVSSQEVVEILCEADDSPWLEFTSGKPITSLGLAKMLDAYGIKPKTIRIDSGKTLKGYQRADFLDAWTRYLPQDVTPVTK